MIAIVNEQHKASEAQVRDMMAAMNSIQEEMVRDSIVYMHIHTPNLCLHIATLWPSLFPFLMSSRFALDGGPRAVCQVDLCTGSSFRGQMTRCLVFVREGHASLEGVQPPRDAKPQSRELQVGPGMGRPRFLCSRQFNELRC